MPITTMKKFLAFLLMECFGLQYARINWRIGGTNHNVGFALLNPKAQTLLSELKKARIESGTICETDEVMASIVVDGGK